MNLKRLDPINVNYLVVHCSASVPSLRTGAAEIDRWHRQRGWLKIGYHYVIKVDGTLEQGRALDEVGAHVEGYNSQSIGICLVGGVDKTGAAVDNFTADQMERLALLLSDLLGVFPAARVVGHRDFPGVRKACPCFDVQQWWATVTS